MKKTKLTAIILSLILVIISFAGCSSNETKGSKDEASTRVIEDMLGEKVTIPKEVNKVCANFPAIGEMFLLLDQADKQVATNSSNANNPWFNKLYPKVKSLPTPFPSTSQVNMEELMKISPDVVIVSSKDIKEKLIQAGIPAVVMNFRNPEELKTGITLLGDILGKKASENAKKLCDYYDNNMNLVTTKTKNIQKNKRPKVYYAANNPLNTEGKDSIVTSWIEMAGGVNVAAENNVSGTFVDVSAENLTVWNPDIIIVRDYEHKNKIFNDPKFSEISAVKNKKVYVNPKGVFVWCVRSADEALQVLWAATVIQPDLFKDINMKDEVKKFYKDFYKYDVTDAEKQDILNPTK